MVSGLGLRVNLGKRRPVERSDPEESFLPDQRLPYLLWFSIYEQLLSRNVKRFRGGLVFKAHRLCITQL